MAQILHPNLAKDPDARKRVEEEFIPLAKNTRNDRKPYDQTLLRYYRIWSAERDQQAYNGRSKTYLPIGRRIIENWVQKLKKDLFANNNDWFDIVALRESFEQRIPAMKALFHYFLVKQMRLRRKSTPWLRQLVTLGTSPVAIAWRFDEELLPLLKDSIDQDGNIIPGKQERVVEKVVQYVGPTFRTVDLFAWFIAPVTVMDPRDAQIVFEEQLVSRGRLKELAKQPVAPDDPTMGFMFENVDELMDMEPQPETSDKFQAEKQRLQAKGFSGRIDAKDKNRPCDITTGFWRVNIDETETAWWRVTVGADRVPLQIQKNPFYDGTPPWLAGKFTEVQNEFYGRGLPEVFDRAQYFLNDIADQANDALVWCMNPIAIVDAYQVQDPASIRMRPGAKWLASPDAVRFAEPPKETPAIGFQAVSQMIGLMNDVSNVTAFAGSAGPRNRGKAVQTATGAEILANENLVQIRDTIENIEDQLFVPMLRKMQSLTMQCLTRPLVLRIAGAAGAALVEHKLTAADVVGDYDFDWLGSTHTMNQQVRGQQMVNYLQIVSRIPPQMLEMQNAELNLPYLLRTIWGDGFGLRGADNIIKDKVRLVSMDPRIENDLFIVGRGEEAKVSQGDNDQQHAQVHSQLLQRPDLDSFTMQQVQAHLHEHQASAIAKQMLAQQQQMAQQQQQLAGGQPGAPQNGQNNGVPMANPDRLRSTTGLEDTMRSITRGPMQ